MKEIIIIFNSFHNMKEIMIIFNSFFLFKKYSFPKLFSKFKIKFRKKEL